MRKSEIKNSFSFLRWKVLLIIGCFMNCMCRNEPFEEVSIYKYMKPQYDLVELAALADTINFPLDEHTYNSIKSINLFAHGNRNYISFHDERSASINMYDLESQLLIKRIALKKYLPGKKLYKTTVYVKNFDSIFVTNQNKLYLINSGGKIRQSIEFIENTRVAFATLENTMPPVYKGNLLYAGVRPYVDGKSFKALKKWKVLYSFDLQKEKATLYYHLPAIYKQNLYGYQFLECSYCVNDRGNFVFSFPADTNIYESNLKDYHFAYYGKSRFQQQDVKPATIEVLKKTESTFKHYITQDSYGPVYFEPVSNRYLRVFKSGVSEQDFAVKKHNRNYRFIILNKHLQIIGESPIPKGMSPSSLFFTKNGGMYARVNLQDEYALHFVRLGFKEKDPQPLAKNEK